jgi:hypothetical protein
MVGQWSDAPVSPVCFEITWSADYVQGVDENNNPTPQLKEPKVEAFEVLRVT